MAKKNLSPKATFVARGYGQVEPNHLSGQKTGQIYAQLPAAKDIELLENGMFATYDYATETVNFDGKGEWMLVYNPVKIYHDEESECDFAMKKDNYVARVYSPIDGKQTLTEWQARFYGPLDSEGNANAEQVTKEPYEWRFDATNDPFHITEDYKGPKMMPEGTNMVPRLIKTNIGDIFTTNTIAAAPGSLNEGDMLTPGADGYLAAGTGADELHPTFQVVKLYTMPDMQPGVKLMRVK